MKINPVHSLFALAFSALLAYWCYEFSSNSFKLLFTSFAFITSMISLLFLVAVEFPNSRTTINCKAVSVCNILMGLLVLYIFNNTGSNPQSFIITMGFLEIFYLGIIYMINQMSTKQP